MDAQAKEIKNKVMCEINSFAIVYFFFDDRLDIINNIKGGIIDFSIINNEVSSPLDHSNMLGCSMIF
jgi:hypothetical protein